MLHLHPTKFIIKNKCIIFVIYSDSIFNVSRKIKNDYGSKQSW